MSLNVINKKIKYLCLKVKLKSNKQIKKLYMQL